MPDGWTQIGFVPYTISGTPMAGCSQSVTELRGAVISWAKSQPEEARTLVQGAVCSAGAKIIVSDKIFGEEIVRLDGHFSDQPVSIDEAIEQLSPLALNLAKRMNWRAVVIVLPKAGVEFFRMI